jgi:hypothetical protein
MEGAWWRSAHTTGAIITNGLEIEAIISDRQILLRRSRRLIYSNF